jgi:hypothetical protein
MDESTPAKSTVNMIGVVVVHSVAREQGRKLRGTVYCPLYERDLIAPGPVTSKIGGKLRYHVGQLITHTLVLGTLYAAQSQKYFRRV